MNKKIVFSIICILLLITSIGFSSYYSGYNSRSGYKDDYNKKNGTVTHYVEEDVNIDDYKHELSIAIEKNRTWTKEKDDCDDDVYECYYMYHEQEFLDQLNNTKKPICTDGILEFYNYYCVNAEAKKINEEYIGWLTREIAKMKSYDK